MVHKYQSNSEIDVPKSVDVLKHTMDFVFQVVVMTLSYIHVFFAVSAQQPWTIHQCATCDSTGKQAVVLMVCFQDGYATDMQYI